MTKINEIETNQPEEEITLESLQKTISSMREELHAKDVLLNNVSKDKERLQSELKKFKRANNNLRQQLEDERAFYLKEKEYYCKEMSVTKRFRQEHKDEMRTREDIVEQIKENEALKQDLSDTKLVLYDTLETNYNLSIKFLRMKNTKYSLKARLRREQTESAKIISDLSIKLDHTRDEINYIISDKFLAPIPPSNKMYLQVVKHNMQLIHENLNYQVLVSRLYNEIERIKAEKFKSETSLRLQYLRKIDSRDKICEVNMIEDSKTIDSRENYEKPSETTISSKDFPLFSEKDLCLCQKDAGRTQSAPEFRKNEEIKEEDYDYENT